MARCHIAQVAELEKICFADPWSEKSIASELENPLSYWLVALEGSTVAGYAGSEALIAALIAGLKKRESHCLTLEVRDSNAPARALYEKLGFLEVGRRKNYYRNPGEDALILRKEWTL